MSDAAPVLMQIRNLIDEAQQIVAIDLSRVPPRDLEQLAAEARPVVQQIVRLLGLDLDHMTGLPLHSHLVTHLGEVVRAIGRGDRSWVAIIYFDLDSFKAYNDTLGHEAGNQLLKAVATRLQTVVSGLHPDGFVARMGGDEFAIVIPDLSKPDAITMAHLIQAAMTEPYLVNGHRSRIRVSMGVEASRATLADLEQESGQAVNAHMVLVDRADRAMYDAKGLPVRYPVVAYNPDAHQERLRRQAHLQQLYLAIEDHAYAVAYQPVVDLATGWMTGAEALITPAGHWPDDYSLAHDIAEMERDGIIEPVWTVVFKDACQQLHEINELLGHTDFVIGVNMTAGQLLAETTPEEARELVWEYGVKPYQVAFELVERQSLPASEHVDLALDELRRYGFELYLDDFGVEYSSPLRLLTHKQFTGVKIDSAFISKIADDRDAHAIVHGLVTMARDLGRRVTAEGVESPTQADLLVQLGCDRAQGYIYGGRLTGLQLREQLCAQVTNLAMAASTEDQ